MKARWGSELKNKITDTARIQTTKHANTIRCFIETSSTTPSLSWGIAKKSSTAILINVSRSFLFLVLTSAEFKTCNRASLRRFASTSASTDPIVAQFDTMNWWQSTERSLTSLLLTEIVEDGVRSDRFNGSGEPESDGFEKF